MDLLARTFYASSIEDDVEGLLQKLRLRGRELETAITEGHLSATRALCSRGIQPELRAQCWKALLGYLPPGGHTHWAAVLQRKRNEFEEQLAEFLDPTSSLKSEDPRQSEMLETVKDEVDLTLRRCQLRVKAESLVSIVFLFLVVEDLDYVKGMSDMAAIIVHVLSQDRDYSDADAYWCFAALVAELKTRMTNVERTSAFVHGLVGTRSSVLSRYDAELSGHFAALEFEPGVCRSQMVHAAVC